MDEGRTGDVTGLLQELARGNKEAEALLIPLVYHELHGIARRLMRGENAQQSLQATALVHEAYLRLVRPQHNIWKDRTHFFAGSAKVMRNILVDEARRRTAMKRGGGITPVSDPLPPTIPFDDLEQILAVDDALTRLQAIDPQQCRVVELRFFAGMTVEETAEALQLSPRTVKREWRMAKAWLRGELTR